MYAATYLGYDSSNLGASSCPPSFCVSNDVVTSGIGEAIKASINGQLASVTIFTGTFVPNRIVIAIFNAAGNPTIDGGYPCQGGGTCHLQNAGNSYLVKDVESLTGLTASAFNTISLASPVTVSIGNWIGILFMKTDAASAFIGTVCGTNCGSIAQASALDPDVMSNVAIDFGVTLPNVGSAYSTSHSFGGDLISGGTFLAQGSGGQVSTVTQCYGNCGSPTVTLANTNSSHTLNFNQSITVFYQFQSQINGFVQNVTTNLARSYTNGNFPFLALYIVNSCPVGQTPFTQQCPGIEVLGSGTGQSNKGRAFITAGSRYPVSNGQWVGIALSGQYAALDLNDTNTNVPLLETNQGKIPVSITDSISLGNSKLGLWAWIIGNVVTSLPPTSPGVGFCGLLDCLFGALINSFCSNVTVACQTSSGIFWAIMFTIMTVMTLKYGEAKIFGPNTKMAFGGEIFGLIFLSFIFIESGLGLITAFVPLFFIVVVSLAFAKQTGRFF